MAPAGLVHDRALIYLAKYRVSDGIYLPLPPPVGLAAVALFGLGHYGRRAEPHYHCVERAFYFLKFLFT